jgi:hypothetical protein
MQSQHQLRCVKAIHRARTLGAAGFELVGALQGRHGETDVGVNDLVCSGADAHVVACTSRRFHRWFIDGSELHTAQSYARTVNHTVHTVPYDAYAYDRMSFFGNHTVCEEPNYDEYKLRESTIYRGPLLTISDCGSLAAGDGREECDRPQDS